MVWSTPRDWATGEQVTVPLLNQELRDNLLSIRNNNDWMVRCTKSANQSLGTTGYTAIPWNVHDFIVGTTALHSTASGEKFMAPVAGWYGLRGSIIYGSASGYRGIAYAFNTTGAGTRYDMAVSFRGGSAVPPEIYFNDEVQMTTADYLCLQGYFQNNTSAQVVGGASQSHVAWWLIGAST